ncbi:DUF488 family protein [Gloeobacter kilaueensis]|uniref:DUF488 domain-containing protein n=1 Tax=Gloeobacter kilaueensis (strain ATCC BAA-2537 / CCAP 1431/1 / ULC 316 / JS1) TaxID=1183438 RepID=U5QRW2_GLOK1|nr:DUF488 domain-containing protein [Gloeobacter kilaueensis]AGY60354.1 hypothetical protein GKIL_4108 [Gloeobacter kilaueensis JS1]
MSTVYTIGFTKRSAASFFNTLRSIGIKRLLDVRLSNTSQLAAFAKKDDLAFFLEAICKAEYRHEPLLAPTAQMLTAYRSGKCNWEDYQRRFLALMHQRQVEKRIDPTVFDLPTVLLCSEFTAEHCHRRLALEYLQQCWESLLIKHL